MTVGGIAKRRGIAGLGGGLPEPLGAFIGRQGDLAEAGTLLAQSRLLTITGTGGCGKTRLAIEVARAWESSGHNVRLVDLTSVADENWVADEVAASLGVDEPERHRTVVDAIVELLAQVPYLVVLDNCEHVLGAVGPLAAAMVQGSGTLRIVATSREPISMPGETVLRLEPLPVADAVELFAERARRAHPGLRIQDSQRPVIRQICERLDGVPLAVELAAAKTGALSLPQIAATLEDRLQLVSGPVRTTHHDSLRASFDWSFDLLAPQEAELLGQLSVFQGEFGLNDAMAVCPDASIEVLVALVERSMVAVAADSAGQTDDQTDEERRYRLLGTIRELVAERLEARPDLIARIRQAHAVHYLAAAETASPKLTTGGQDQALARLDSDRSNTRAALVTFQSGIDPDASDRLARLSVALGPYWLERSSWTECRHWLTAAGQCPDLDSRLRASVINLRCYLEMWSGEPTMVPGLTAEALELVESLDAPREHGQALGFRAMAIAAVFGPDAARSDADNALNLLRAAGDGWGLAMLLAFFSHTRLFHAQPDGNTERLVEAMSVARTRGDRRTLRLAESMAAFDAVSQGRIEDGSRLAESALLSARDADHEGVLILALTAAAWSDLVRGDIDRCRARVAESVQVAGQAEEDPAWTGTALWVQASADLAAGAYARAVPVLEDARTLTAKHRTWAALPLLGLADAAVYSGDAGRAADALAESERVAESTGSEWVAGRVDLLRACSTDDPSRAETMVNVALARSNAAGDRLALVDGVEYLAAMAEARSDDSVALRLWSAAATARDVLGCARQPRHDAAYRHAVGRSRERLGEDAATAWSEGECLSLEDALTYASRGSGRRRRPAAGWHSLTPTEMEVVRLVAEHRSNPEIAQKLFISRATVKTHLIHIFTKLGVSSRSELAAQAIRRGES